jgi:hypothetical protein
MDRDLVPGCRNWRNGFFEERLLTRAAQKALPSRDREGALYASFRKQVLVKGSGLKG